VQRLQLENIRNYRRQTSLRFQVSSFSISLAPRRPPLDQITFSIITPSYNQIDWLRLCVASVRDQAGEKAET